MSGGLAPSKSTIYLSNFSYCLTNNDLHKICEPFGRVVKVSIVKDRQTRKNTGTAFILYEKAEDAFAAEKKLNQTQLFGRTVTCKIANDNGRAREFIRRREYPDKSKCYECGEEGHLSYNCPKNSLGPRVPVKRKKRKKGRDADFSTKKKRVANGEDGNTNESEPSESESDSTADESLSVAIQYEQARFEEEDYRIIVATHSYGDSSKELQVNKRKKIRQDNYFSDEEVECD